METDYPGYWPNRYWPAGYWAPGYWFAGASAYATIAWALREKLLETAAIASSIEGVFPFYAPQLPSLPIVLYHTPRDFPIVDILYTGELQRAIVQFDCLATSHESAWDISEQLRKVLQGYEGTHLAIKIFGVDVISRFALHFPEFDEFRVVMQLAAWYKRIL